MPYYSIRLNFRYFIGHYTNVPMAEYVIFVDSDSKWMFANSDNIGFQATVRESSDACSTEPVESLGIGVLRPYLLVIEILIPSGLILRCTE